VTVEAVNAEERKTIWEAMLDTEQAARYWAKIAYRLQSRDKFCGYLAFLLTVAAALTIGLRVDWWAQFGTSLVTSVVTGITIFYRFGRSAEQAAQLHRLNAETSLQYQSLWNRLMELDASVVRGTHETIQRSLVVAGSASVREFKEDKALAAEAQQEVLKQRGLHS
jgi:hypothetical protein